MAGGGLGEVFYLVAVASGLIVANEPCGSYLRPYNCLMIDPRTQLIFVAAGGTIGFLFYFVNFMHKRQFAFRMEVCLVAEGLVYAGFWVLLPAVGDTAYFVEIFTLAVIFSLAGFILIDRFRTNRIVQPS